jgi:hypothetical protein
MITLFGAVNLVERPFRRYRTLLLCVSLQTNRGLENARGTSERPFNYVDFSLFSLVY